MNESGIQNESSLDLSGIEALSLSYEGARVLENKTFALANSNIESDYESSDSGEDEQIQNIAPKKHVKAKWSSEDVC